MSLVQVKEKWLLGSLLVAICLLLKCGCFAFLSLNSYDKPGNPWAVAAAASAHSPQPLCLDPSLHTKPASSMMEAIKSWEATAPPYHETILFCFHCWWAWQLSVAGDYWKSCLPHPRLWVGSLETQSSFCNQNLTMMDTFVPLVYLLNKAYWRGYFLLLS